MWSHSPSLAPEEANITQLGGGTGGRGWGCHQPAKRCLLPGLAGWEATRGEQGKVGLLWFLGTSRHVERGEGVGVRSRWNEAPPPPKGKAYGALPGLFPSLAGGQHSVGLILELSDTQTNLPLAQRALLLHLIHISERI